YVEHKHRAGRGLLAVPSREKLARVLKMMLDEKEFLSPYGLRSLSAYHREHPSKCVVNGKEFEAHYAPGESDTDLFGGNSNWRGPGATHQTGWTALVTRLLENLARTPHEQDVKQHAPGATGAEKPSDKEAAPAKA